jgi:hypothetical protein
MRRLAIVAVACLAPLLAGERAEAAGGSCQIITYYEDADMTGYVGTWSNCPGMKGLSGRRSRYFEVETEQLPSGPSTTGGSLPCEFLAAGCSHIPTPRYGG